MTLADTRLRRRIQKEISKRYVDATRMTVNVTHGVIDLRGEIRPLRGMRIDLQEELEIIEVLIRRLRGVRDVRMEIKIPISFRRR